MHHHNHHRSNSHNSAPATTCCCSCRCTCTNTAPAPPLAPTDPLFQALASLLQQSTLFNRHRSSHFHIQSPTPTKPLLDQRTHSIISSLSRRIDALESTLPYSSSSLKHFAARIIQSHFRSFLVRRSITLRHLQDLATIRSRFIALKSFLSNHSHFDFPAISHKAVDLLIKLDSIKGGNPLIREGKRSISRDLVRFLDFIDEVYLKRHQFSHQALRHNIRAAAQNGNRSRDLRGESEGIRGFPRDFENVEEDVEFEGFHHVSDDEDDIVSNIIKEALVKGRPVHSKLKKHVSFAEDGKVIGICNNNHIPRDNATSPDGSVSSDDHGELVVDNLSCDTEEIKGSSSGTGDHDDNEDGQSNSEQISSHDKGQRRSTSLRVNGGNEVNGNYEGHGDESFRFSAPVPVKMEPRAEFINKRKSVKQ